MCRREFPDQRTVLFSSKQIIRIFIITVKQITITISLHSFDNYVVTFSQVRPKYAGPTPDYRTEPVFRRYVRR